MYLPKSRWCPQGFYLLVLCPLTVVELYKHFVAYTVWAKHSTSNRSYKDEWDSPQRGFFLPSPLPSCPKESHTSPPTVILYPITLLSFLHSSCHYLKLSCACICFIVHGSCASLECYVPGKLVLFTTFLTITFTIMHIAVLQYIWVVWMNEWRDSVFTLKEFTVQWRRLMHTQLYCKKECLSFYHICRLCRLFPAWGSHSTHKKNDTLVNCNTFPAELVKCPAVTKLV